MTRHFRDEFDWVRLAAWVDADVGKHSAGFYVGCAHRLFGQPLPPLTRSTCARLTDRRWELHARGRLLRHSGRRA